MSKTYSAFDTALYYLSFKDKTSYEMKKKLREMGYSEAEICEALDKLVDYDYINDERYANAYLSDYLSKKGRKLIFAELSKKGIDKEILDNVEYDNLTCEETVIEEIYEKRFLALDINDDKVYRRVCSFFLRRGFLYDNISKIIAKYRKKL